MINPKRAVCLYSPALLSQYQLNHSILDELRFEHVERKVYKSVS